MSERDFTIILGNQGAGKSLWTKLYTRGAKRFMVFDPKASYPAVYAPPETYADELLSKRPPPKFRYGTPLPDDVGIMADLAFTVGEVQFVIEEAALFFRRSAVMEPWAKRLVFMARERRVHLYLVAQRAASIPIDVRSQASRIVSFRQIEPEDCRAVGEFMGRDIRDELPALPDYWCFDWQGGKTSKYSVESDARRYLPGAPAKSSTVKPPTEETAPIDESNVDDYSDSD